MKTKQNRIYLFFICFYLLFFSVLVAIGSFYDPEINKAVFNPENSFAEFFEIWGEVPRFAMWAPAAAVLLLTRHSLAECFEILHRLLPFIPVLSKNALETKAYRLLNFLVNAVEIIGFFVLCVLGWDKLIRNVGKYYVELNTPIWYALSAAAAVLLIALCSGIPKRILKKLEPLTLAGILIGILYCFLPLIKGTVNRVRFREMVAFSNGIENAKDAAVTNSLLSTSDFSLFTQWYQKGNGGAILNGLKIGGESCPSGHVLSGTFSLLLPLLCSFFSRLKKFTVFACLLSFIYITVLGFTRMVRGAHFLTDISLGAILGMLFFLIALSAFKFFEKKKILPI